jgi:hypothetical protein
MAKERRAPPYMRWDQRGRPVLQATLKLPDSTEFRAMLNTDDRKIAGRRMQLIVVLLVPDGRLPGNSRAAQLYGRRRREASLKLSGSRRCHARGNVRDCKPKPS